MDTPGIKEPLKASGAWSRASWVVKFGAVMATLSVVFYGVEQRSFLEGHLDRGQVFGRDFINYWTGSRLLIDGKVHAVFVQSDYARELARLWGPSVTLHSFS